MSVNLIKKYLSYFVDIPIEKSQSLYNKELTVVYSRGRYRLDTMNATYSYEDLYRSFYDAFVHMDIANKKLEKVLILGLGLGSIALMLESKFNQNAQYTSIELDAEIIRMAKKYTPSTVVSKMELLEGNAMNLNRVIQQKFDLIAFDVFLDDETDAKFREKNYLATLKSLLSQNGFLFYNTLTYTQNKERVSSVFYEDVFREIFKENDVIETTGNRMFVGWNV